ncbi:MAG: hypothetical protein ABH840_00225 [Nanoarchaeota archaeon]
MKKIFLGLFVFIFMMGFVSAMDLLVNSPISSTSNNRTVLVNLSSNGETADFYFIRGILGPNNWILLCKENQTCITTINIRSGVNNLMFKAVSLVDGSSDIKDNMTITIDTRKPSIHKTTPNSNAFVNESSLFDVKYSEDDLANITLSYGTFVNPKSESKDCTSGKNKICSFSPNLTEFDGQMINFSFSVFDNAGNVVSSRTKYVKVDLTEPNVTPTHTIEGKKVTFFFEVIEDNFDKIKFIDYKERRPVWRTLCSNLQVGRCYTFRNFAYGVHNLTIIATDKAKNSWVKSNEIINIP